jgi:hypothetical protein
VARLRKRQDLAQLDALKAEAEAEEVGLKAEALERGEPFGCPRWYVGGNHFPLPRDHPLRDRSVKKIRVYADDRVVPAVYDD